MVTLDDILSALDPQVQRAFKVWQQSQAAAINGRGEQINANIAELEPFVENANKLVRILASQEGAVTAVVHNTGVLFDALTERDDQFRGFIVNGERTFHALSASSAQWANAFRLLPAFERGATATLREFDDLARVAGPVLEESKAWERELTPLLEGVQAFTPDFNNLLTNLGPFNSASKKGLPAFERVLSELTPVLGNVTPPLRNFEPFLKFTGEYVPELQALFANATAASQAHDKNDDVANGQIQHYLRALQHDQPRRSRGLQPADRHQPRQPLLPAGRLPAAGQRRAAGVQHRELCRLRAVGRPENRQRNGAGEHHQAVDRR